MLHCAHGNHRRFCYGYAAANRLERQTVAVAYLAIATLQHNTVCQRQAVFLLLR